MKYLQIQKDYISKLLKRKQGNKYEFVVMKSEDGIFIGDGYALYNIPEGELLLNLEGIEERSLDKLIGNYNDQAVHETDNLHKLDKGFARILKNEKFEIVADNKYFKYFNQEMQYVTSGELSPLKCYENEKLVAIIMPIRRG